MDTTLVSSYILCLDSVVRPLNISLQNFQNGVNPFDGIPDLTGTIDVDKKTFIDAGGFSDIFSGYFKTDMNKEKKVSSHLMRL